jgi:hypothetical protein
LAEPYFQEIKSVLFNEFVINPNTKKIEVIKKSHDWEKLKKIWDKLNKVLRTKFCLKSFYTTRLQMSNSELNTFARDLMAYPFNVNCLIVKNPLSFKLNDEFDANDFSVFHDSRKLIFVMYNSKEEMSKDKVFGILSSKISQLIPPMPQEFIFLNTTDMKNFIIRNKPNWIIEILEMHNKFYPCFVANVFELSGSESIRHNNYGCLEKIGKQLNPLIFTDLHHLRLFQKLCEKTSTENESEKQMLSRWEIPNFYKNIYVIYSSKFSWVLRRISSMNKWQIDLFSDDFIGFYLDIEEADEVYAYKGNKIQERLNKMLKSVEVNNTNDFFTSTYYRTSRSTLTLFEHLWVTALIANMDHGYSWVDVLSSSLFFQRMDKFMLHFQENESGTDYSYKFPEWSDKTKSVYKKWAPIILKFAHKFLKFRGWSHWNKNHPLNYEEEYITRKERFKRENGKYKEIIKNIHNYDSTDFIQNDWRNHKIPRVFANMKKEVGYLIAQHSLMEMFEHRSLEINYFVFIKYFINNEIWEKFFDREDYEIDGKRKIITIKNWLMIPVLGILKMLDDYKNDELKQGFELGPYATFTDPKNEKPYIEIQRNQIREGECRELSNRQFNWFSNYEKNYELTNWNAYLTYNGVKYFYCVQNKFSSIYIREEWAYFELYTHQIYKFLYSWNPIDLITSSLNNTYRFKNIPK